METENLQLVNEIIKSISQVLLVVVPALLTGIFVYLSGKRSGRIEIDKLKGQHEFEARTKIYEFLKEQKQKLSDSHGSLSASLVEVLGQYLTLMGQNYETKGNLGGDENEFYQEYKTQMDPMVFTLFEVVNNQQRDLERMVKGTIQLFKKHKDEFKDSISELEDIEFPPHLTTDDFEYQSIKERVFRLQEINGLLSHHNDIYMQDEMEKLLETYITKKPSEGSKGCNSLKHKKQRESV